MNKVKKIYSLRYRMVIGLGISLIVALFAYIILTAASNYLIETHYLNESAIKNRSDEYIQSFAAYIKTNAVSVNDPASLRQWMRSNPDLYVSIYNGNQLIWESGWWGEEVDSLVSEANTIYESISPSTGSKNIAGFSDEITYFPEISMYEIAFSDGRYSVYISDFTEQVLYDISTNAILAISTFLVFPIVLFYSRRISKRVIKLTNEVYVISSSNLRYKITMTGKDEISQLATEIDSMRKSIIEQLEKKEIAWRANSELITSMSHDIRTPLTVLLGYTGLIKNKQYSTQEEFDSYVEVIEKKSIQLKELSDKLFKYFLVFGNEGTIRPEFIDASEIFSQLLGEHSVLLQDSGFTFETIASTGTCKLKVDLSYIERLFDNVFSNIEKYADKNFPCTINIEIFDNRMLIRISNKVRNDTDKVESTRIGIRTCEKIMERMGGQFIVKSDGDNFSILIIFPIIE